MLPYLRRNRPERKHTCAQHIWDKKGYILLLLTVFGYLLFLNKQLYDEHRRTVAMEKQLQELTLERLHEEALRENENERKSPGNLRNAASFGRPNYERTQHLRGPQSIDSGRSSDAAGTAAGAKKPASKSQNEKAPVFHAETTVPSGNLE